MSRSLLILRPIDGARRTAKHAEQMGLSVIIDPLFEIDPMDWTPPPAAQFDALLLTSANAVSQAGKRLEEYRELPVLAVGEITATAALQAGLNVVKTGDRGVRELLAALPDGQYQRLLRLTGKHHIDYTPPEHDMTLCHVYRSRALPLGKKAQEALRQGHVISLYSPRAGKILSSEMDRLGLDRSVNDVVALSPNVAEAVGSGWKTVQAAEWPNDDSLLSLASALCQL
ncbi:uroporphyrinogen-III synthase [Parasphingorhabdus sp. JC815]|uniref:uroporphyrinogen-III synthase n=1 Tax=Parasphingorhabdus sp. JC815 TaxID=3232140 RepID=UPI003457D51F